MSKVNIHRGANGFPAMLTRKNGPVMITTTGGRGSAKGSGLLPPDKVKPGQHTTDIDEESGKSFIVPWGTNNNFPDEVLNLVEKSTVGSAGLRYLTKMILGQESFTYTRKGFDAQQRQIREYVDIDDWEAIQQRTNFDLVRIGHAQDYTTFAIAYAEIIFDAAKNKVYSIGHIKARNVRLQPAINGRIEYAFVSANFPDAVEKDCEKIKLIDPLYFPSQIEEIREDKSTFRYLLPLSWPDPRRDYYSLAYWDSSRSNGYMAIGNSIPEFKKALFENQMSLKYHIQVALEYWEWKYPNWEATATEDQERILDDFYQEMVDSLTGAKNAQKALMTFYRSQTAGAQKSIGEFKITVIDDKMKNEAYLPDAAAANAEVLFSMLINPAETGLGSSSGAYTGGDNNGGSNIRESRLSTRAMMNPDRAILNTIFKFTQLYNGYDPKLKITTMDEVLTTLDTGAGTAKKLD